MTILWTIAWPLLILGLVILCFWVAAGIRLGRWLRSDETVRAGLDRDPPPGGWPRVSIIVPVHDEARVIEDCVESLTDQSHEDLEIIFVLDRCTDDTGELLAPYAAADDRITIVENDRTPSGWAGKCNAARIGAQAATGSWLLFADADTRFDPRLVEAAVASATTRDVGLLSLLSTLTFRNVAVCRAQPVAAMNLMWLFPVQRIDRGNRSRPFANGQFMLFRRDWYARVGGHAAVRADLLEDIAFARRVHHLGGRTAVMLADGMLACSMYESLDEFRDGWKRIFIEACKRKPGRVRQYAYRVLGAGVVAPIVQMLTLLVAAGLAAGGDAPLGVTLALVVGVGLALQAATLVRIYALSQLPPRGILGFPAGSWIVARLMLDAAHDLADRRTLDWGGLSYVLDPR